MQNIHSTNGILSLPGFFLSLGLLILVGCTGAVEPGLQLPAEPQAASQTELESLWDQIGLMLSTEKPGSNAALKLQGQQSVVGNELANRAAAAVRSRLSQFERVDDQIPLGVIERELEELSAIQVWSPAVYAQVERELETEFRATQRTLDDRETQLEALAISDVVGRLDLLEALSAIAGSGSKEQPRYVLQREKILRNVSEEAENAILNEDYEKAQSLLGIVQEVDPTDTAAREAKCQVDGKVILKRFNTALETGRVGRTIEMLTEFSETDCFNEVRDGLAADAVPIAEAFGMLGQESTAAGDLTAAYRRYQDANVLSTLLLERRAQPPGMASFLKKLDTRYQKAFEAGEFGAAWGYLNVMTELGPTTPQIRQKLRKTRDEIARRAVRGLTAYPFEDAAASAASVGDAVSSKVVQHIFRTIPSDVRIVERDQLERILSECKRGGTCGDLDTADFIVQGTILDAKVETTSKVGRETRRVVTGQETVTNPAHEQWSKMRERAREQTPEPPFTIRRDVTEDVTIEVNNVRKVGIISVSYRIVEASSGRVLFTDSMQTKQEFQDEGRQGVQLGNFKQETDFVELPPDIEILSGAGGLSDKISEEIGVKLVTYLQDPEEQYASQAQRFVQEGDYLSAARKAAYAIVLREIKSKDTQNLKSDLKSYAMDSPAL